MPLIATRGNSAAGGYGWSLGVSESLDGMVLMTPTSVTAVGTGSSATIVSSGSVEFSACTGLSLNGVFTSSYDNYLISVRSNHSGNSVAVCIRLRASGTDNNTASSYVGQSLSITGTTESGSRTTADLWVAFNEYASVNVGATIFIYGPNLAQATAMRTASFEDVSQASICDYAGTHNQATSYDGFSLIAGIGITGLVSVYGLEN